MPDFKNQSALIASLFLRHEMPDDISKVEALHNAAFGPGRFGRTAFRLRESKLPRYDLSTLAFLGQELVGAVRLTDIMIGSTKAVLLGPLCAQPTYRSMGVGAKLMAKAVADCKNMQANAVLLIGDLAYYQPFGFERVPQGQITLPGPVDPMRILIADLSGGNSTISGPCR